LSPFSPTDLVSAPTGYIGIPRLKIDSLEAVPPGRELYRFVA
jgi:hypothetical protein